MHSRKMHTIMGKKLTKISQGERKLREEDEDEEGEEEVEREDEE